MEKSKLVEKTEKITEAVAGGYKKVEEAVVGGYQTVEDAAVGGFQKVEDWFVGKYLLHEGESVEDAKKRLAAEQAAREAQNAEKDFPGSGPKV